MVEFLDNYKFLRIVKKYDGNKYVKHFTCWNQLHIPADTRSAFPVISVHSPVSIQYRWQS